MNERSNVAQVNEWLSVGNCEACPESNAGLVIHIYRSDHPGQERYCVYENRRNLRMNYRDGDELNASDLRNLDVEIERLKTARPRVLVHCHAGACRSPTVAVYLLAMVEGMHPIDAQWRVAKEIYEQRSGKVCNVVHQPMKQIIRLWESHERSPR